MDLDGATAIKVRSRGPAAPGSVPALTVAAHPDPARVGDRFVLTALGEGRAVELSRAAPEFVRPADRRRALLGDRYLSRTPIRLSPASFGRIVVERGDSTILVDVGDREIETAELGPLAAGDGVPIALADRLVLVLHLVDAVDVDDAPTTSA